VVIVRPFNTYGPRQSARAIIPTVITQALAGYKEIKLGSLHPRRDLTFVKDTVSGFIAIAKAKNAIGEEINIAAQEETSIGDLARKILDKVNPQAKIVTDEIRIRPEKSEVQRLLGSNKKIGDLTGWKPSYNLDKGLDETIAWFKDDKLKQYKPRWYNV